MLKTVSRCFIAAGLLLAAATSAAQAAGPIYLRKSANNITLPNTYYTTILSATVPAGKYIVHYTANVIDLYAAADMVYCQIDLGSGLQSFAIIGAGSVSGSVGRSVASDQATVTVPAGGSTVSLVCVDEAADATLAQGYPLGTIAAGATLLVQKYSN